MLKGKKHSLKRQTSELDSDMAEILKLSDWEFKVSFNMLMEKVDNGKNRWVI